MKPKSVISFWDGSSRVIRSYLNMEKRLYGMFGTNYEDNIGNYFMQFKVGKDGVNDTAEYLTFNRLHGRITPITVDSRKTMLLDFWEFTEDQVKMFLEALELSIDYHIAHEEKNSENYKTSHLLIGAKVSISGVLLSSNNEDYAVGCHHQIPPLEEILL